MHPANFDGAQVVTKVQQSFGAISCPQIRESPMGTQLDWTQPVSLGRRLSLRRRLTFAMPFLIQEAAIEARVAARKATTSASITGVPIVSLSSLVQDFDAGS